MAYDGEVVYQCLPVTYFAHDVQVVIVSGDGMNVCGHALLYSGFLHAEGATLTRQAASLAGRVQHHRSGAGFRFRQLGALRKRLPPDVWDHTNHLPKFPLRKIDFEKTAADLK
jgi:hypothetical protein